MAREQLKWFDSGQPQTLQGAVILCYLNAAFGVLALLTGGALVLPLILEAVAGVAIANDRRWGYWLGVVVAALYAVFMLFGFVLLSFSLSLALNLAFAVVLVALLLHRQSRSYERIYFH